MSCGIYDFAWDKQPEDCACDAGSSSSALKAEQNRVSVVAAMSWSLRFLRISLFNTSNMLRSKPSASSAGRTRQSVRSQARLPYLLLGHDVCWFQYFLVESWFASPAFVFCAWPKAPRWFPPTIEKKSQLFAVPWSWTDNFDFVVIFAVKVSCPNGFHQCFLCYLHSMLWKHSSSLPSQTGVLLHLIAQTKRRNTHHNKYPVPYYFVLRQ